MAWTVNISIGNEREDLLYVNATYTDEAGNTVSVSDTCAVGHYDTLIAVAKKTLDAYCTKRIVVNKEAQIIADLLNADEDLLVAATAVSEKGPSTGVVVQPKVP